MAGSSIRLLHDPIAPFIIARSGAGQACDKQFEPPEEPEALERRVPPSGGDAVVRIVTAVVVHGVRHINDLAYQDYIEKELPQHEFIGEQVAKQLHYYPTVTREAYRNMGRITDLITSGKLFEDLGTPPLDARDDRVMICGSPGMLKDLKHMLEGRGFKEGSTTTPGDFVIERAFAEQ